MVKYLINKLYNEAKRIFFPSFQYVSKKLLYTLYSHMYKSIIFIFNFRLHSHKSQSFTHNKMYIEEKRGSIV